METMKTLPAIYNSLTKYRDKLSVLLSLREDVYESRSYEWQDSERGQDYMMTTERIEEILEGIEQLLTQIETL